MSAIDVYVDTQINTIKNSTYGSTIRTAIANALEFIDNKMATGGFGNNFVVCTQDEYDSLDPDDKTAAAYFIVADEETVEEPVPEEGNII